MRSVSVLAAVSVVSALGAGDSNCGPASSSAGFQAPGLVLGLEHHVALERFADLRLEFEDRQLQQADGLLQLRGHRELLAKFELQGWLEHSSRNFGSRIRRVPQAARSQNIFE